MEPMRTRLPVSNGSAGWAAALVAVAAPAAVSLLALGPGHRSTTAMALLFVLAVVVSTSVGGRWAGIAAGVLSFLSLNFFFTPPVHTFKVANATDVIALFVFLTVSLGLSAVLAASIRDRVRAERRELELRLMNRLATSLLSMEPLVPVLERFGEDINEMLGSARCLIKTAAGDEVDLQATGRVVGAGGRLRSQLTAKDRVVGEMSLWPPAGSEFDADQVQVAEAFGKQLALALEAIRLREEVRRTELEAESHRLKASLFSGVTHDVKTPLAAITASVTSLLEGRGFTVDQSREHLEMIKQEAERLHRVVNNLLDLSRLRAGAHQPVKEPVAVDEVVESVVARMRHLLDGREVIVRIPDDLPDAPMDVVQIDQVLTNLIENAMKFSPSDTPVVVSAVGDADNVRITVADSGPGVPKEDQELIFEPFHKGSPDKPGTGLGLAIARAIVTAHGGALWVSRSPAGGAAFTFELRRTDGSEEVDPHQRTRAGR